MARDKYKSTSVFNHCHLELDYKKWRKISMQPEKYVIKKPSTLPFNYKSKGGWVTRYL